MSSQLKIHRTIRVKVPKNPELYFLLKNHKNIISQESVDLVLNIIHPELKFQMVLMNPEMLFSP